MSNASMPIQDLLAQWSIREKTFMGNIGIATHFFSSRFSILAGTPEEYAHAFGALNRHIPWEDLINYEVVMRQAVFETTGLYASMAGDARCASGKSTRRAWNSNVAKACLPFRDGFTMPVFMQSMLDVPALTDEYKLDFCRHAHPRAWCNFEAKQHLIALLPPNEELRLGLLPWHHGDDKNNMPRTVDIDAHQRMVVEYCPRIGPLLVSVLPKSAWRRRALFLENAAQVRNNDLSAVELPEGFAP